MIGRIRDIQIARNIEGEPPRSSEERVNRRSVIPRKPVVAGSCETADHSVCRFVDVIGKRACDEKVAVRIHSKRTGRSGEEVGVVVTKKPSAIGGKAADSTLRGRFVDARTAIRE